VIIKTFSTFLLKSFFFCHDIHFALAFVFRKSWSFFLMNENNENNKLREPNVPAMSVRAERMAAKSCLHFHYASPLADFCVSFMEATRFCHHNSFILAVLMLAGCFLSLACSLAQDSSQIQIQTKVMKLIIQSLFTVI